MSTQREDRFQAIDSWALTVEGVSSEQQTLFESLLAQANGYIGCRGSYEEALDKDIQSCEGVYLNGVYHQEPIQYGEKAYGYASFHQKMQPVPNGKRLSIKVDEESLKASDKPSEGLRRLDLQSGVLSRKHSWRTKKGKQLTLHSRRFVSLANPHLMAIEYQITADNFNGAIELSSALDAAYGAHTKDNEDDPRAGFLSIQDSLNLIEKQQTPGFNAFIHQGKQAAFTVASATLDVLPVEAEPVFNLNQSQDCLSQDYLLHLKQGQPLKMYKWIAYKHRSDGVAIAVRDMAQLLKKVAAHGFEHELDKHQLILDSFWQQADVAIEGAPEMQQAIRFNMFHVFQSAGRNGQSNIAAKGLTGPGYDGHYFWDTEIYVIPFLCLTQPEMARKLIEFRVNTLQKAQERARQMAHAKGALYPWRTIGGEECSAYFPAGTAQYHINAAIAFALKTYLQASNDQSFLWEGAAVMLFETARLWIDLGHFNPAREGLFCIDGVTGPDEYTAMVNNNFYTNAMAKMHLQFAFETAVEMAASDEFAALAAGIRLADEEINQWQQAAEKMYLPYDLTKGINPQDDSFLDKKVWDFANTPKENYPLLLHYHPLVIYRHQLLKQADVILAMYLLDEQFSAEQKQKNLAYYEPLTTHDSSLSSCIHAMAFCEAGDYQKAYNYFTHTARMDLDNSHANSEYGVHIACMSGAWAAIVHGFAGLRMRLNGLCFRPHLPSQWKGFSFNISYREQRLLVEIHSKGCRYTLLEGENLVLYHFNQRMILSRENNSQEIAFSEAPGLQKDRE